MGSRQLIALCLAIAAALALAVYLHGSPRKGKTIFREEGCVRCHVFRGAGAGVIDLSRVTERRSDAWIRDQITDSRRHNPYSGMPRFGHLSDAEIDNLIRFLHGKG